MDSKWIKIFKKECLLHVLRDYIWLTGLAINDICWYLEEKLVHVHCIALNNPAALFSLCPLVTLLDQQHIHAVHYACSTWLINKLDVLCTCYSRVSYLLRTTKMSSIHEKDLSQFGGTVEALGETGNFFLEIHTWAHSLGCGPGKPVVWIAFIDESHMMSLRCLDRNMICGSQSMGYVVHQNFSLFQKILISWLNNLKRIKSDFFFLYGCIVVTDIGGPCWENPTWIEMGHLPPVCLLFTQHENKPERSWGRGEKWEKEEKNGKMEGEKFFFFG